MSTIDRASVSVAREQVREASRAAGLDLEATERLAIAVSELAQNQLDHARDGWILVRPIGRDGVGGVEIVASDRGPGIVDPAGAIEGRAPGQGLGVGLASVRRMVDELDLDVRLGEGTVVVGRRFARTAPRRPEVAVMGRGVESRSGDVAVVLRTADHLVLAAVDGAGHGPLAREVADRAAAAVTAGSSPTAIVAAMDDALRGTRGAAATVAVVDRSSTVTLLGVGNVSAAVVGPAGVQRYLPQAGMLGRRHRPPTAERTLVVPPTAFLVLCTDGISSDANLGDLAGRSAIHVAQRLLTAHGKAHDDALVLVAR